VHGGVLSAVFDVACFHALLSLEIPAFTVDLAIRYRKPVRIGQSAEVHVDIIRCQCDALYEMRMTIVQATETRVTGTARFLAQAAVDDPPLG
jgi:acyl-coenzyme A thioesterase PaaI-like protein